MKPLSHSSMSLYEDCPAKYKFKYIDKIPETPKSFFSFGKSIHQTLEHFYNNNTAPTLEDTLQFYKDNWISEGYKTDQEAVSEFEKGRMIVIEFYNKHAKTFRKPLYAEYMFNLKINGIPVIGVIDRVDSINGKITICDYKTGNSIKENRIKDDPQLMLYQIVAKESLGLDVDRVMIYHVNSLTPHISNAYSDKQIEELKNKIVGIAKNIESGNFEAKPEKNKCKWCDFNGICNDSLYKK